jgi:hypothetical protein
LVAQRFGCLEAEEAAAHHDAAPCTLCTGANCLQILDRAVNVTVRALAPGYRRNERKRTSGQHQLVVAEFATVLRLYATRRPVDAVHPHVEPQLDTGALKKARRHHGQVGSGFAGKERRELHAIVCGARLFPEHGYRERHVRRQRFQEPLADHAVSNHHESRAPVHERVVAMGVPVFVTAQHAAYGARGRSF